MNFGIVGVSGFVAPRHLRAIRDTGNTLVAALDPHDSAGVLDSYAPEAAFFTEPERFDRYLYGNRQRPVECVSICSPNYLHDAHARMAMRSGAGVICEKPLVINPWNLDQLERLEHETGQRVWTVLQLRLHPALISLREQLGESGGHEVELSYVTARGPWYHESWKGDVAKSGGVAMNIGIHFFDLLIWLFGKPEKLKVKTNEGTHMGGTLELQRAKVNWFLSLERRHLPIDHQGAGAASRTLTVDGQEVAFSDGFADLHTQVYSRTLAGRGFGIADARPSIELTYRVRTLNGKTA